MYRGNGFLAGRCVIPIRDENSRLVAYAGRAVHGEAPKYRFPSGFRKSHLLFNLDRARHAGARNVIVVEGFFDALKVHQAGHPVVALMGTSFSQRQSELLTGYFTRVTLLLDGDEPGRRAAEIITQLLMPKMPVRQGCPAKRRAARPTVFRGNQLLVGPDYDYSLTEFPSAFVGIPIFAYTNRYPIPPHA